MRVSRCRAAAGDPIVMLVGHQLGVQRARIAGGDRPLWVSPSVLTAGVMLARHRGAGMVGGRGR